MVGAIYRGTLRHRRFRPASHEFSYGVFMVLLDIDRIPEMMRTSRCLGLSKAAGRRLAWARFDDRDHLGDPARPLRERLVDAARAEGIALPDGPILLLTNLRVLGYCFNPVSFYYCFDRTGVVRVVASEVHNVRGESHTYWVEPDPDARTFQALATKVFYVSPFLTSAREYRFVFTPPEDRLVVHMDVYDDEGRDTAPGTRLFDATLTLHRRAWSAREIRRALFAFPWMTGKVIAAIHWEALRLWLKGVRYERA